MRRTAYFTLPLLLLFFTGCADQATAPELDVTASFAKKVKPPPDPPPPEDPVDPMILFSEYGGRRVGYVLSFMDTDGNREMALSGGEAIEGTEARWAPSGTQFVFTRGISIRKAPDEHHIMIGTLDDASGEWGVQRLMVSSPRAFYPTGPIKAGFSSTWPGISGPSDRMVPVRLKSPSMGTSPTPPDGPPMVRRSWPTCTTVRSGAFGFIP